MLLREEVAGAPFCQWTVCVFCILSECLTAQCCDIQSLWCGKWGFVGLEEGNQGKKWLPQITDTYQLSDIWLIWSWLQNCWHWLFVPVGYHSQKLFFAAAQELRLLFVLFLRFIVVAQTLMDSSSAKEVTSSSHYYLHLLT